MSATPAAEPTNPRFSATVARLGVLNALLTMCAFLTSPILARSLGPVGRGQVAAIFAVVGIAPWFTELGITAFLSVQVARQTRPIGELLGSSLPISVLASGTVAILASPIAHAIGHGRTEVVGYIEIALYILPLAVISGSLSGIAVAQERWRLFMSTRAISTFGATAALVVLAAIDRVSVSSVATVYIVASLLSTLPLTVLLKGARPWCFRLSTMKEAFSFGIRSWLSVIAAQANTQLDQVLMAGLVPSRQLGLYALAVTISTVPSQLLGAIANALVRRVATGDIVLVARASRVSGFIVLVFSICVAASSPVLVPVVFGSRFDDSIPMLLILLAGGLTTPVNSILSSALIAAGQPTATAIAQIIGLVVTVPGLILLLPILGGIGAAVVSAGAYVVICAVLLVRASRQLDLGPRSLLIADADDMRWLRERIKPRVVAALRRVRVT